MDERNAEAWESSNRAARIQVLEGAIRAAITTLDEGERVSELCENIYMRDNPRLASGVHQQDVDAALTILRDALKEPA